jgi:hypothetical protein
MEFRIRQNNSLWYFSSSRHNVLLLLLRALSAIFGTALLTILNPSEVKGTANNVITHTRQILYPATTNQNHGVLLKIVTDTWNIGGHNDSIGQTDTGYLTQS